MAQVPVRGQSDELDERLKECAKIHERSLQGDRVTLERTTKYSVEEALAVAQRWQQKTAGRIHGNSADLIRDDRDR